MAAAVADYRVAEASERKLAKEETGGELTLRLVETDDILAALVRDRLPGQTIVGFAAETETDAAALLDRARRKRRRKGVDLLAVNEVGWQKGFETADNTVTLLGADDEVIATVSGTKREVADALWDAVLPSADARVAASARRSIAELRRSAEMRSDPRRTVLDSADPLISEATGVRILADARVAASARSGYRGRVLTCRCCR